MVVMAPPLKASWALLLASNMKGHLVLPNYNIIYMHIPRSKPRNWRKVQKDWRRPETGLPVLPLFESMAPRWRHRHQ